MSNAKKSITVIPAIAPTSITLIGERLHKIELDEGDDKPQIDALEFGVTFAKQPQAIIPPKAKMVLKSDLQIYPNCCIVGTSKVIQVE